MNKIIVAFHIGRGGHFNNSGNKTFIGEKNFQDLISIESDHVFIKNRDYRTKRFCKPTIVDGNDNLVSDDNINALTGTLNFDNEYNTDATCYLEDCTTEELQLIQDSNEYKSYELQSRLNELLLLTL